MSERIDEQTIRERSVALLNYLRELVLLRATSVKSVESFEKVIWLGRLPKHKCISTDFSSSGDPGQVWLKVTKPKVKRRPQEPASLREWLDSEELEDPSCGEPQLGMATTALSGNEQDNDSEGEGELGEEIEPSDEILTAYCRYVEDEWRPWAQAVSADKEAELVYRDLFTMYQRQEKLGETYEIVIGLGLLRWKSALKVEMRRHLLVAKASLAFDAGKGTITIGPGPNGPELAIEEDMVEAKFRPGAKEQAAIRQSLAAAGDAIWDQECIDNVLEEYSHSVGSGGSYESTWERPGPATEEPNVTFSPAIILRARPQKSVLQFLEAAISSLQAGAGVPFGIERLVTVVADQQRWSEERPDDLEPATDSDEIYFPRPANEEQLRVVEAMRVSQGVLVQGPPGTGKSHTIANLICNLIAHGKRVLVTSHTERALKVLKGLLPPEMQSLCVQLVGADTTGLKSLEQSVEGISEKHADWDPQRSARVVSELQAKKGALIEIEGRLSANLMASSELSTYEVTEKFGRYTGTPLKIAEQLRAEAADFLWFKDSPAEDQPSPVSNTQAVEILNWLREHEDLSLVGAAPVEDVFDISDVPGPDRLKDLVVQRSKLREMAHADGAEAHPSSNALEQARQEIRSELISALKDVVRQVRSLERHVLPWAKRAARDILGEQDRKWRMLVEHTEAVASRVRPKVASADEIRVSGAEKHDCRKLIADCEVLSRHLESKGKIGMFVPSEVRSARYVMEQILVDGRKCQSQAQLESLKAWAEVTDGLGQLEREWNGVAEVSEGSSFKSRLTSYEEYCEPIDAALKLHEYLPRLRKLVVDQMSQPEIAWHDDQELEKLLLAAERADSKVSLLAVEEQLQEVIVDARELSRKFPAISILGELANAASSGDCESYTRLFGEAARESAAAKHCADVVSRFRSLQRAAPILASSLLQDVNSQLWSDRFNNLDGAWRWGQARCWLERLVCPEEAERIETELRRCRKEIADLTGKLAAELGWAHCMNSSRMTDEVSENLKNWSLCVRRMPKNTGKRTAELRIAARKSMDKCRSAIPAWIMPVHRVAESVTPGGEMYDVVITDEASQSGVEELFLNYVARQTIVVGDDKQISPPPFTATEAVTALRERFLKDIPMPEMFAPQNSLFDAARVKFGKSIQLREHFRCMPEIIQFSNDLCYSKTPLIPLKPFGSGRLDPVIRLVRVEGGKAVGKNRKINKSEADCLIDALCKCIDRPEYAGKTFGVISLLGGEQSRYIERELLLRIEEAEFQRRRIVCGDAYAFQGDERDVMFLSIVAAPAVGQERIGHMTKEDDERRFNVAMSRAKEQVWLFHSVDAGFFHANDVRKKLLNYCANPWRAAGAGEVDLNELRRIQSSRTPGMPPPIPFDSWLEFDICLAISERGYQVIPQFEIHGRRIDLVVQGTSSGVAVECDGDIWHGPDQWQADTDRQHDLERCGWEFKRILGSYFYLNPEAALEGLWRLLDSKNIHPRGWTEKSTLPEDLPENETPIATLELEPKRAETNLKAGETIANAPPLPAENPPEGLRNRYVTWSAKDVPDPVHASLESIAETIKSIIETEGPVSWSRVLTAFRESWAKSRLKGSTRENVKRACRWLVNRDQVIEEVEKHVDDWELRIVRLPTAPRAKLRLAGPRDFEEIPPSEIALRMLSMGYLQASEDAEWYFEAVKRSYGISRAGSRVRPHLEDAKRLADDAAFRHDVEAYDSRR